MEMLLGILKNEFNSRFLIKIILSYLNFNIKTIDYIIFEDNSDSFRNHISGTKFIKEKYIEYLFIALRYKSYKIIKFILEINKNNLFEIIEIYSLEMTFIKNMDFTDEKLIELYKFYFEDDIFDYLDFNKKFLSGIRKIRSQLINQNKKRRIS